jgi:hypothetical protein
LEKALVLTLVLGQEAILLLANTTVRLEKALVQEEIPKQAVEKDNQCKESLHFLILENLWDYQ